MKKPTDKELHSFSACVAYGFLLLLEDDRITHEQILVLRDVFKYIQSLYTKEPKMKKQTKHQKIIALYKEGMKPKDIAVKVKTTVQNVYAATCKYRKDVKILKEKETCFVKSVTYDGKVFLPVEETKNKTLFTKIKRFLFGA
jgi:hypothetical protein